MNSSDQASLQLCNLLSRGLTMAEARAELAKNTDGQAGEQSPAAPAAPTHTGIPQGKEALQEALRSRGIPFHPRSGEDKLAAIYKAEVLDKLPPEAPETPETQIVPPGHSEPNDGND